AGPSAREWSTHGGRTSSSPPFVLGRDHDRWRIDLRHVQHLERAQGVQRGGRDHEPGKDESDGDELVAESLHHPCPPHRCSHTIGTGEPKRNFRRNLLKSGRWGRPTHTCPTPLRNCGAAALSRLIGRLGGQIASKGRLAGGYRSRAEV